MCIITDDNIISFQICQRWVTELCYLVYTQTVQQHVVVLPPCLPVVNSCDVLWNTHKRKLADKDESAVKKQTGNAGGEFEWNINGLIEEIPDHGNVDVVAILHVQPEELS